MVENVVENIASLLLRVRVQKRLCRNAVCEQKDDAQQCEVQEFNYLEYTAVISQ